MGTKRKHQEAESQETVHASRQAQVYGHTSMPAKKPRRFEPPNQRRQAHASSVNSIKKRIRDVSRRLEHADDLPADVRAEDERALAAHQQELASAEAEKIRQKMIKKYHMVRFFERQKATRLLKKLRKRLLAAKSTEEVETLKTQMHIAEVDLNYTQYYPLSETYISIYPQKESSADETISSKEVQATRKPPMWSEVEKCTEDGTLALLRNRTPISQARVSKTAERNPVKAKRQPDSIDMIGMNRRERRSQRAKDPKTKNKSMAYSKNKGFGASLGASQKAMGRQNPDQDEDDSEGGFFEE